MKNIALVIILLCGCTQSKVDLSEQTKKEIMDADIAMSDMASKEGFNKTLLLYADDDVVKLNEGEFPVIGKTALMKYWQGKDGTKEITWAPFKAEGSKSGDIGYTLGNWKFVTKDSTYYGNYYTIWKKNSEGKWKFVADGGNGTPPPQRNF